jgi:RimJ/RimL family protein N-acetyltransferase
METIRSDRLVIRNFSPQDWVELRAMIVLYQGTDSARYDHKWPTSSEEIQGITVWFAGTDSYLAVYLKTAPTLIGFIAIDRRDDQEDKVHNLGFIFHPDYQGQGFAAEACRAVMRYLFDRMGVDRILTGTHPANQSSVRLLKRLGLKAISPDEYVISRDEWLAHPQASTS